MVLVLNGKGERCPCVVVIGWSALDLECHLASAEHLSNLEVAVLHVSEFLPVMINNAQMLHHVDVVFPSAMFGLRGVILYDKCFGMALSPDVSGAVRLYPYHRYRVVPIHFGRSPVHDRVQVISRRQ